ncbi:MAG: phosphatidylglycerol lysyltransferase domain-containing protein [Clostridiales bacterium]|nr:phosphatidylglycerol lysyltransferase domain-containing protein [Clostridiales bacterium]
MLNWKSPETGDCKAYRETLQGLDIIGSDISFANLFLLQNKYQTKIAFADGFLFRKYSGSGARQGYTVPVGRGDLKKAFELIIDEARELGEKLRLAFVTDEERSWLEEKYPGRFVFTNDPGDSDYIYLRDDLANLRGRKYSSKRNHIYSFSRAFEDHCIKPLTGEEKNAAMEVARCWREEHGADKSISTEYDAISKALDNFEALDLKGAVLYVEGKPVGMTVASYISPGVADIHFEKVLGEYARFGGYAVINKLFAELIDDCRLINREEDINIPGLRKSKQSYRPEIILKKYGASEVI